MFVCVRMFCDKLLITKKTQYFYVSCVLYGGSLLNIGGFGSRKDLLQTPSMHEFLNPIGSMHSMHKTLFSFSSCIGDIVNVKSHT